MSRQPFPGTISSVVAQERKRRHLGQRVNVFIGEKFSFALDLDLALEHGLRPGFVVSPQLLEELLRKDGDARGYARALHFLSYRPRSAQEVRQKLQREEFPDPVIDRVVERLQRENQLNDAEFAAIWVESRSLSRPRGARALQQELRIKGIDRETIAASLPDTDEEMANALHALGPKLRQWMPLPERERRDKILGFLQRRGFAFGTALAAVRRLQENDWNPDIEDA